MQKTLISASQQEFCETAMSLTKLCPFSNEGRDKNINNIASTRGVLIWDWGLTVNQIRNTPSGRFLLEYLCAKSMLSACLCKTVALDIYC